MLFLVFGATLDLGYRTRQYFASKGFTVLRKYNYVEDSAKVSRAQYENPTGVYAQWYDDKVYVSQDEYAHCDFRYELGGIHVGFNQDQIMDAVHGVNDSVLTLGGASLDFIRNIKRAYGGFVTVLYTYVSEREVVRSMRDGRVTQEELEARVRNANGFCQTYLDEIGLFDGVILYSGEDGPFPFSGVCRQYDEAIERSKKEERRLVGQKYVDIPYCGEDPYVFISYSRKDKQAILPILRRLQGMGYRVWYDDGVRGGQNWRKVIYEKVRTCTDFLLFCSAASMASPYVEEEMDAAELAHRRVIPVHLDQEEYPFDKQVRLHHFDFLENSDGLTDELAATLSPTCRI